MTWMKLYQPQDMDAGLTVVSAPTTVEPISPVWYRFSNGVYTVEFHSPGSGNFIYSGTSLVGGTMDQFTVYSGTVPNDANRLYSVGTAVDPVTYIALAQAGDALGAQSYLLSGSNDYIGASSTVAANVLNGYSGDDIIIGGAGDDIVFGGPGCDQIDGAAGSDTARFVDVRANYYLVNWNGTTALLPLDPVPSLTQTAPTS